VCVCVGTLQRGTYPQPRPQCVHGGRRWGGAAAGQDRPCASPPASPPARQPTHACTKHTPTLQTCYGTLFECHVSRPSVSVPSNRPGRRSLHPHIEFPNAQHTGPCVRVLVAAGWWLAASICVATSVTGGRGLDRRQARVKIDGHATASERASERRCAMSSSESTALVGAYACGCACGRVV
jgi:hypothetical protein